jgi:hypothetical protein
MTRLVVLALLVAGCTEPIDERLDEDYTQWKRFDVTGDAPGHSNSYRIIYVNDIAADPTWPLYLGYQEGSIIVKEIYARTAEGQPGALNYIAIMRRIGPVTEVLVDEGGWLFSETDTPGGAEHTVGFCWARCHVAAPYNGAWYDYRQ